MSRPGKIRPGCLIRHTNPLPPDFPAAGNEAYRRIMSGWKQKRCPGCKLWMVWVKP